MDTTCAKSPPSNDGRQYRYDLFLGVPAIRAPKVLEESGMTENKYVPVKPKTLETRFPDVYAVGDCAKQGTPKYLKLYSPKAPRARSPRR